MESMHQEKGRPARTDEAEPPEQPHTASMSMPPLLPESSSSEAMAGSRSISAKIKELINHPDPPEDAPSQIDELCSAYMATQDKEIRSGPQKITIPKAPVAELSKEKNSGPQQQPAKEKECRQHAEAASREKTCKQAETNTVTETSDQVVKRLEKEMEDQRTEITRLQKALDEKTRYANYLESEVANPRCSCEMEWRYSGKRKIENLEKQVAELEANAAHFDAERERLIDEIETEQQQVEWLKCQILNVQFADARWVDETEPQT